MFPDGTHFYPDNQNGKYGFNTDPQRGADTFRPFNISNIKALHVGNPINVTLSCNAMIGQQYIIVVVALANWWGGWKSQTLNLSGATIIKNDACFQADPYNPSNAHIGSTMMWIATVKATADIVSIRPNFGNGNAINGFSMIV